MKANILPPTDRASFDNAINAILDEHNTLRRLALSVSQRPGFSSDDAMSLADAMTAHEETEARLFAMPFVTRPPESVISTGARARRRCQEFTSGDSNLPDPSAAAALFVDALLTHLATEEAWLARERKLQIEH